LQMPQTAVVELAQACGLSGLNRLEPLAAHTAGVGELLLDCLARKQTNIVVALGGSASTDGGTALLSKLGAEFLDADRLTLPFGGGALSKLADCDLSALKPELVDCHIQLAVDVDNPLLGKCGAANVYAPQKGASTAQVNLLEAGLSKLADLLEAKTGRVCRNLSGAGAAGGTAFGLNCVLGAEIISGFTWVSELLDLDSRIAACDLVISAEGKLDRQSFSGKVIGELSKKCRAAGKPLWILPAQAQDDVNWQDYGIELVAPVAAPNQKASNVDIASVMQRLLQEGYCPGLR